MYSVKKKLICFNFFFVAMSFYFCAQTAASAEEDSRIKYIALADSFIISSQQDWGVLGINEAAHSPNVEALELQIRHEKFSTGIGTHANGTIVVDLNGQYESFEAAVGVQWQGGKTPASVVFEVFVDGEKCFDSGVMREADPAKIVRVDVAGADELKLLVTNGGDGISYDLANWADAHLYRAAEPVVMAGAGDFDVAGFAKVMSWDTGRTDIGYPARVGVLRVDDIFHGKEVASGENGGYALPEFSDGRKSIGLEWVENRIFKTLKIEFDSSEQITGGAEVAVQCWRGNCRWRGRWESLDGRLERIGNKFIFHADPRSQSDKRHEPQHPDFAGRFLIPGTPKIRWIFGQDFEGKSVRKLEAYAYSRWDTAALTLEFEEDSKGKTATVEIYNGRMRKLGDNSPVAACRWATQNPLEVEIYYAKAREYYVPTTLRIHLPGGAFAVSVYDVLEKGCVYVKEFGLFVTPADSELTIAKYHGQIEGRKSVLQRVRQMPDQSFGQAMEKIHYETSDKGPIMLSLACGNDKFIVAESGRIDYFAELKVDHEQPRYMTRQNVLKIKPVFGFGKGVKTDRHLLKDHLPIPVTTIEENGIAYRHLSFVSPYGRQRPGFHKWISREALFVAEIMIENTLDKTAEASVKITFSDLTSDKKFHNYRNVKYEDEKAAQLEEVYGGVLVKSGQRLLGYADISGLSSLGLELKDGELALKGSLPGKIKESFLIYIPGWEMTPDEYNMLVGGLDLIADVEGYWKDVLAEGMQIKIPEKGLEDVINASVVHCLIAARNDENGEIFSPWIASAEYGALESESHAIVLGMDQMGFHDFARRSLDFFIDQYKPDGHLTTGYTLMGMGQHLYTLGEHFKLNNDRDWLEGRAPKLAKACEWIINEREKTKRLDANGEKLPEYGLMPPGVAADWPRFGYRSVLEGYFYAGLNGTAGALEKIGYPGADALFADAKEFREAIRRAYKWSQARSPVLELSNGTWVPYCPGMVYCFGRIGDVYKGEDGGRAWCYDVELGAHHLVPQGVLNSDERDVKWMSEYTEDVWFLRGGWNGYQQAEVDKDWFNLGGFGKVQPYYCRVAHLYALADDVKPFIRAYFNAFPTLLNTENLSFWEHFNGIGGWNKTHETGWFLSQSRTMFVMERNNELWLAPFVTNHWMKDGMEVSIDNADTNFGSVSYNITSAVDKGYIEAVIKPKLRVQPEKMFIRLRHPNEKHIKKVIVNGKKHNNFNAEKEYIELKATNKKITVIAKY